MNWNSLSFFSPCLLQYVSFIPLPLLIIIYKIKILCIVNRSIYKWYYAMIVCHILRMSWGKYTNTFILHSRHSVILQPQSCSIEGQQFSLCFYSHKITPFCITKRLFQRVFLIQNGNNRSKDWSFNVILFSLCINIDVNGTRAFIISYLYCI